MADTLNNWKSRIQEKRKQTPWREFVKQIASWQPIVFYKYNWLVSRFPQTDRIGEVVKYSDYYSQDSALYLDWMEYDKELSFFENWQKLRLGLKSTNMINFFLSENSDYWDVVSKWKNVYLSSYVVNTNEDIVYSFWVKDNCSRVFNSAIVSDWSENIYSSLCVSQSYETFYSRYITNSSHIWFSVNLIGCKECLFCDGLENASYCIKNKQYTKEEYLVFKNKLLRNTDKFEEYYDTWTKKTSRHVASWSVSWRYAVESDNLENAHYPYRVIGWRNLFNVWWSEWNTEMYDVVDGWGPELHHVYWVNGVAINTEHAYLSCHIPNCSNVFYCFYTESCSYCFGCIGLKNKQYCIFNKQYDKETWHEKVNELFHIIDTEWMTWEFFPASVNPFYMNDTVASLIEDLPREEIVEEWYLRRDEEIAVDIPDWMEVIEVNALWDFESLHESGLVLDSSILKKVIKDKEWNVFRVIKMEYDFLKRYNLPLPREHWLTRLKDHFRE